MDNKFYLVSLEKKDKKITNICFNRKKYLTNEELESLVVNFNDEDGLKLHLLAAGIINGLSVDLYVVYSNKNNSLVFKDYNSAVSLFNKEKLISVKRLKKINTSNGNSKIVNSGIYERNKDRAK